VSWTGFYLGGNIGAVWADGIITDTINGLNFNASNEGRFIAGGQAGLNYQFSIFVIGVEADFDWGINNKPATGIAVPGVAGLVAAKSNDSWLATVAGRFGLAYDCLWLYGKAGAGWVGNHGFSVTNVTTGESIKATSTTPNSGWLVGGGLEWAFASNWTAKVEFDYLVLANRSFVVPGGAPFLVGDTFISTRRDVQMLKVGMNYLFNAAAVRSY
jgi:outer membrane immunogenic protein